MAWYSIDMPESSVSDGVYHRLCREFQKAFISAGAPPELALFACRNSRPHRRRLYLSPLAASYVAELLQVYAAKPCRVPDADSVTLVYGVPNARTLLSIPDNGRIPRREVSTIYPISHARQAASNG